MTFDLEEQYFYKEIPNDEWEEITRFLENYLSEDNENEPEFKKFYDSHPNIKK